MNKMPEHKPLYLYSLKEAVELGEKDEWRESYLENCDCARAIERAIDEPDEDGGMTLGGM